MDEETKDHKLRLLAIYQVNLRELEVQAANHGKYLPLPLINEIKHHRKNIENLRIQLELNAQEVSFDKLLVGIEELQKFIREEGTRAVKEYNRAFGDQAMLGFGLMAPLGGGILLTMGLDYLYRQYVKGMSFADQYDLISIAIYIIGVTLTLYFTYRLGSLITQGKHDYFVYRMGYDPFDREKK
jgi:hypothetical protein